MSDASRLGEQMRDFLRGLLQVRSLASPAAATRPGPQKWAVVGWASRASGSSSLAEMQGPSRDHRFELNLPGQKVIRVRDQWFDPNSLKRVSFSVTHDPVETLFWL